MNSRIRQLIAATAIAAGAVASAATLQPTDDPQASPIWQKVQASLFEGRPVLPAPPGLLALEVPARAIDAAVVPLAIRTQMPAGSKHHVARLILVIDANPSENPNFRFYFIAQGGGELRATVSDSHDRRFAAAQAPADRAR